MATSRQRTQVRDGNVRFAFRHLPAHRHAQEPPVGAVLRYRHAVPVHVGYLYGLGLAEVVSCRDRCRRPAIAERARVTSPREVG